MKLRIGSRESRLAVIQSQMVMELIAAAEPAAELELVTMKTTGDKILDKTLDKIGGKGLFVRELDQALREGKVDFTVHSLKDMPMEVPEDLPLAAFSSRETCAWLMPISAATSICVRPRKKRRLRMRCSRSVRRLSASRMAIS